VEAWAPEAWWITYLALGLLVGLLAGMLGIGGGVVIVPLLVFLFNAQHLPAERVLHLALGTSLASIVFAVIIFDAGAPGRETLAVAAALTVLLSVMAHGASANPLIAIISQSQRDAVHYAGLLGLTPSGRASLSVPQQKGRTEDARLIASRSTARLRCISQACVKK